MKIIYGLFENKKIIYCISNHFIDRETPIAEK